VATEFFGGCPLSCALGATNIVLIPKVESSNNFTKFRPTSLCPVVYKILSKIMDNQRAPLLDKFISQEQSAFIQGRSIFDNISIAQEMMHSFHKKVKGGNILLKIAMEKA